jgi:hypothetical protein
MRVDTHEPSRAWLQIVNPSRVQNPDDRIPLKVVDVESEDVREAVAMHGGNKSGVVCWFSDYGVIYDEFLPRLENAAFIPEGRE